MKHLSIKTASIVIVAMLLGISSSTFAQKPMCKGAKPGSAQGCCKSIPNLTEDQSKKITTLRTAHQKSIQLIELEMAKKDIAVKELLLADKVDLNAVNKAIDEQSVVCAKRQKAKIKHHVDVSKLLTDEQKVHFNKTSKVMGQGACMKKGPGQGNGKGPGQGKGKGHGPGCAK